MYPAKRNDTEYILASVKEQEIQFERLTKELEEERNTVAHQLQRCKITPSKDHNKSLEEEHEESDTESRRGAMDVRDVGSPKSHESKFYPQTMSSPLSYGVIAANNDRNGMTAKPYESRNSPVKMMKPHLYHHSPHQQQPVSPTHHPSARRVEDRHPFRPTSIAQVEDPGSPPFPTYASPPASTYVPLKNQNYVHYTQHPNYSNVPRSFYNENHPSYSQSHGYIYYPPERHYYQPQYYRPIPAHPAYYASPNSPQIDTGMPPPLPPRDSPYLYYPYNNMKPTKPNYAHRYHHNHGDYQNISALSPVHLPSRAGNNHQQAPHHKREKTHFRFDNISSQQPTESTPVYHSNAGSKPSIKAYNRNAISPRQITTRPQNRRIASPVQDVNSEPHIIDVINMLRHPSYEIVANAAAYLQHISFGNDKIKTIIREHGVLPLLVNLLHHHVLDVQQNACGALRNMVFGKSNDEAKLLVRNCGGIASLSHVLRLTDNQEMKELITGVLWNLSSCDQLKISISDSAMPALASRIIIYYVSMLDPIRMGRYTPRDLHESSHDLSHSDLTINPQWATIFINATGCLRNISSAGVEVRSKMRSHEGLIEALLLVIENVIGKNDVDSKGVENCMCILRNLSYRLALEVEAANLPISRSGEGEGCTSKEEDCWRRSKMKKEKKRAKEAEKLLGTSRSRSPSQVSIHGVEMLWQAGIVRRYLALLAETCNPGTLEAATGALQNLTAGQWVWSESIRAAVRKEKGLPMLVEFLHMDNQRIVTVMCSTLRNMALDERNKQLIGKHAMRDFMDLLPEVDSSTDDVTDQKVLDDLPTVANLQNVLLYEAVCCALTELVTANLENATLLYEAGAIPKLVEISRGGGYRYPHRLVKSAGRVLATLWEYKNLRTLFKQQGWTHFHFNLSGVPSIASVGSQVSPFSSPPISPSDTSKESNYSPAYSKIPTHASGYNQHSPSRPNLPYAPMSSSYHSAQPDANYVMLLRKDEKILAESLV